MPNETGNAGLQAGLSNVVNALGQSSEDLSATNSSLHDQSTMTTVQQ